MSSCDANIDSDGRFVDLCKKTEPSVCQARRRRAGVRQEERSLAHCARVREDVEKLFYKAELHAKRQRLNDVILAGDVYVHLDLFPSLHKVRQPREYTWRS